MVAAVNHGRLSLDSPRWAELTQAYGTAEDVPRLLEALACIGREEARAEVWFALWRTLHRPGEVREFWLREELGARNAERGTADSDHQANRAAELIPHSALHIPRSSEAR